MVQSYKTISRFLPGLFSGLALLSVLISMSALAQTKPVNRRGFQQFTAYSYRFALPEAQAGEVWKYLQQQSPHKPGGRPDEDNLIDLYFDSGGQQLLKQGVILRERLFISGAGRKQVVQLIIPAPQQPGQTYQLEFRPNRKPDKGRGFTTHSLLKLIRTKDRPALDSLLQPYQVRATELKPVLEITRNRRQLYLRRGNTGLVVSFSQLKSEAPEHVYTELEISPDRKTFTQSQPDGQQQLMATTRALAQQLQQKFPALEPETRSQYQKMVELRKSISPGFSRTKVIFGLVLLLGMVGFYFLRKKFRKDLE
ncbi:MAG TPA: hypothetical protein VK927_09765 [Adhaeribacter sp.]|nr:hypothetical protein [Adhaeribacter sp.]